MSNDNHDNVINILDHLPREPGSVSEFSMEFFSTKGDRWEANITSFKQDDREPADRLRRYAEALDGVSFMMRNRAEQIGASGRGPALATVTVYKDSTVKVRVNDGDFSTQEQMNWLFDRFDDAKIAAFKKA